MDAPLPQSRLATLTGVRWLLCSREDSQLTHTHLAKMLVAPVTEELRARLLHESHVARHLEAATPGWMCDLILHAAQPTLVYRRLSGHSLDAWSYQQPQQVSRSQWVSIALSLCDGLQRLHRLGFAHCRLRPDHVWLTLDDQVQLLGLGHCTAIGELCAGTSLASPFDPPEMGASTFEVSSAVDIYAAAQLIDCVSQGQFATTRVGEWMRASDSEDRPTSGELVELFRCYLDELQGHPSFHVPREYEHDNYARRDDVHRAA